ncbi:MAG: hypothetical protein EAZ16_04240 [Sphingobacteriales bacterium]|nr:MAG: hypothetical protein EAZ16_04240 [Sphingobacteriales bacterium]
MFLEIYINKPITIITFLFFVRPGSGAADPGEILTAQTKLLYYSCYTNCRTSVRRNGCCTGLPMLANKIGILI